MGDATYTFQAPPTLYRFLQSDEPNRLVMGPVGSGKSSACIWELVRRAMETPKGTDGVRRSRFAVIRNTYRELKDTTRKTFSYWLEQELAPHFIGHWMESDFTFVLEQETDDGRVVSEFLFRALDRPGDARKLLSLELTGAYINEAREIALPIFEALQGRLGRYPAQNSLPSGVTAWAGVWMDTNPPDQDSWLYRLFEEERPPGYAVFRQPGGLSPGAENIENLRAGYYEKLRIGKNPDWIKIYIDGQYGYVADGKPVYPEFKDNVHVQECDPLPRVPINYGIDHGRTPAAVIGQRHPDTGQLRVYRELVTFDMGAVDFGRELKRVLAAEFQGFRASGWSDPAGMAMTQVDDWTPISALQAQGISVVPAPTNDFMLRREAVAGLLSRLTHGEPALVIHPRCTMLRKAMAGGYAYKRLQVRGDERYQDVPDKNRFSHVAEALQYLAVGLGEHIPVVAPSRNTRQPRVTSGLRL